jgi:DNA-binding transcriptional MerR regulator
MTNVTPQKLRIAEVSKLTGLSGHTLRYYEQERLLPDPVDRDGAGHRVFTEEHVEWLRVCTKMRATGMSLDHIRRYAELQRRGPDTVRERYEILREHEKKVRSQLAELQEALDLIERKTELYERSMANGTADALWRNGPECGSEASSVAAHEPSSRIAFSEGEPGSTA